jgi:hypothetical protein
MKLKINKSKTSTQKEMLIDFTLHKFPVTLLSQFTQKIVNPYYKGNFNKALTQLLTNSIKQEELFLKQLRG